MAARRTPPANTSKEAVALRVAARAWAIHGTSLDDDSDPEDTKGARLNAKLLNAALAYARRARPTAYDRLLGKGVL